MPTVVNIAVKVPAVEMRVHVAVVLTQSIARHTGGTFAAAEFIQFCLQVVSSTPAVVEIGVFPLSETSRVRLHMAMQLAGTIIIEQMLICS